MHPSAQSPLQLRNHKPQFLLQTEAKIQRQVWVGLLRIFYAFLETSSHCLRTQLNLLMQVTFQRPIKNLGSFTPVIKNPPAATPATEKDPRIQKRRRALDYLSRIPSPPPLSSLGSLGSPCVNKTFNPPRKSGTPSTLKTLQIPSQKPTEAHVEDELVNDEELAMIDTQALLVGNLS